MNRHYIYVYNTYLLWIYVYILEFHKTTGKKNLFLLFITLIKWKVLEQVYSAEFFLSFIHWAITNMNACHIKRKIKEKKKKKEWKVERIKIIKMIEIGNKKYENAGA